MRIRFQTKITLCLLLTVGVLLGASLFLLDRAYSQQVQELIGTAQQQGRSNFNQSTERIRRGLLRDCMFLAQSSRLKAQFEEERLYAEAGGIALYEVEFHAVGCQFLSLTTDEGRPVARYLATPGWEPAVGEKPPLEPRPIDPKATYPEAEIVKRVLAGEDGTAQNPYIVDEGRLFQAMAVPMFDGDLFRGIVVLGVEIDDRVAKEIHDVQAPADHAGYVVGGKLVASSFPTGGREAATQILAGRLAQRASSFDASIDGSPFFVVLRAIHPEGAPEPIFTGLYISLKTLVDFRNRMRALLLSVAGAAILLSLFTSMLLARGVSRPVHDLVDGTVRVASGEYSHHIDVRSRDELGDLATAFNKMAGDLATKEKIRGVLNKVVAKDVAEELLKGDLGLGGRRMKVSLIFADLRGFTAMSQGMSPEKIVAMLNEHMTAMSAEILACKGIVDKYVGDEIIGVFGAPKSYGDDTLNAVRAAYRMCRRLVALNEERAARGDPPLRMGIGVNTGEVVAGCMGSEEHLNYTCIGENVNLASRLCSNAKAGQILVSEATRADTDPHVEYARLEPIKVKGYEEAIQVYEVMGLQLEDRAAALGS